MTDESIYLGGSATHQLCARGPRGCVFADETTPAGSRGIGRRPRAKAPEAPPTRRTRLDSKESRSRHLNTSARRQAGGHSRPRVCKRRTWGQVQAEVVERAAPLLQRSSSSRIQARPPARAGLPASNSPAPSLDARAGARPAHRGRGVRATGEAEPRGGWSESSTSEDDAAPSATSRRLPGIASACWITYSSRSTSATAQQRSRPAERRTRSNRRPWKTARRAAIPPDGIEAPSRASGKRLCIDDRRGRRSTRAELFARVCARLTAGHRIF